VRPPARKACLSTRHSLFKDQVRPLGRRRCRTGRFDI